MLAKIDSATLYNGFKKARAAAAKVERLYTPQFG
jgi:hypothetical protein